MKSRNDINLLTKAGLAFGGAILSVIVFFKIYTLTHIAEWDKNSEPLKPEWQALLAPYFPDLDLTTNIYVHVDKIPFNLSARILNYNDRILLGPDYKLHYSSDLSFFTITVHELVHSEQWKKWGILSDPIYLLTGFLDHEQRPWEIEAREKTNLVMLDLTKKRLIGLI